MPPLAIKEKPPINVVGDVGGRIAIMVDDLIDDVKPFVDAALILKGIKYNIEQLNISRYLYILFCRLTKNLSAIIESGFQNEVHIKFTC